VKSKIIKRRQIKKRRKGVVLHSTGRSGATHGTVRCMVCELVALGFSLATSAINHRTVRARRRIVRCSSHATAICHVDKRQRSPWRTVRSDAPHKRKIANQGLLCRVLFTVRCTTRQSGVPPDRRQELPSNWNFNDS
jgi:hypothetical protein